MRATVSGKLDLAHRFDCGVVVFNPGHGHKVVRSRWLESVEGALRRVGKAFAGDLFCCACGNGRYLVGLWEQRPLRAGGQGTFSIVQTFGAHPDRMGHSDLPTMESMIIRMDPLKDTLEGIVGSMRQAERDTRRLNELTEGEKKSKAKWFRRVGDDETARMLERGLIPYMGEDEAVALGVEE